MNESRVKNSAFNMVLGFSYQLITLILSFISRTVFLRTLGLEFLGINSIFSDILNLLSMADLGFNTTMAYSFYKPLAENDERKLTALICFYRKVYRIISIAVTTLGLAIIPFLRYLINTEKEIPHLVLYYLFSLAGIVISYLFVYRTTILTADQKNYKVLGVSLWTTVLKTSLQVISMLFWKNYIIYLSIGIILQFINNLIASKKADKMYPYIKNKEQISLEEEKSIFHNMKSVFLYKISGTMFNATTNILISMIAGTVMVGLYSNYQMISSKLLLSIQIIFSALTASIGNVIAMEKTEKRYEIFCGVQSVSFILCGIITSVFFIMVNDVVFVWLGSEYTLSTIDILAMTINTYLACVLQPLWTYRDATGLYIKTKYIMCLGAILNIVLSIVMGSMWGLTGILFASAVARLSTYFWYEPKILFHDYFERRAHKYYTSLLLNIMLVVVNIGILTWLFGKIHVDSWMLLFAKGTGIGVVCTIVFFSAYVRTEGFIIIYNKLKSLWAQFFRKRRYKDA